MMLPFRVAAAVAIASDCWIADRFVLSDRNPAGSFSR